MSYCLFSIKLLYVVKTLWNSGWDPDFQVTCGSLHVNMSRLPRIRVLDVVARLAHAQTQHKVLSKGCGYIMLYQDS